MKKTIKLPAKKQRIAVRPTGYVLWEGISPMDNNTPIVAIATMKSSNKKTGNMIQVWVMVKDLHPFVALNSATDYAICGNCKFRGLHVMIDGIMKNIRRACYVNMSQAVTRVWDTYQRGKYPKLSPDEAQQLFNQRKIRWGAYGDPAMLPESMVSSYSAYAKRHTGYTHQWRLPQFAWCREFFQASCDTLTDFVDASTSGWGTFNVLKKGEAPTHTVCPSIATAGKVTCLACTKCDGASGNHIDAPAHGSGACYV